MRVGRVASQQEDLWSPVLDVVLPFVQKEKVLADLMIPNSGWRDASTLAYDPMESLCSCVQACGNKSQNSGSGKGGGEALVVGDTPGRPSTELAGYATTHMSA